MIWLTSDTHFFHERVIEYSKRPFRNAQDMNKVLINNWNSVVEKNDIVYHIGDFSFANEKLTTEIFYALNGEKHLILGNHDFRNITKYKKMFTSVNNYYELNYPGKDRGSRMALFHYPIEFWNKRHYGSIHCHGHSHGSSPKTRNRFDVGVDCWNYFPVSVDQIISLRQEVNSQDSHHS